MFERFSVERHVRLREAQLAGMQAVRLFHLWDGRNAWHSTWNEHGIDDIFLSMSDAKKSAERRRRQGSVFFIREHPALLFRGTSASLVVTDLRSYSPLRGYSWKALRTLDEGTSLAQVRLGAALLDVARSFDYHSPFWRYRSYHLADRFVLDQPPIDCAPLRRRLKVWKSMSWGGGYSLAWLPTSARQCASALPSKRLERTFLDG